MQLRRILCVLCVLAVWSSAGAINRDVAVVSGKIEAVDPAHTHILPAIQRVRIKGHWNIQWDYGTQNRIDFSGLASNQIIRVEGGTLYFVAPDAVSNAPTVHLRLRSSVQRVDVMGPTVLTISAPITRGTVAVSSGAEVTCSSVNARRIVLEVFQSGKLSVSGTAGFAQVAVTGQSVLDASDLIVQAMWLYATDNVQAKIAVVDTLRAFTKGHADVYYAEKPRHLITVNANSSNVWWSGGRAQTHNPLSD